MALNGTLGDRASLRLLAFVLLAVGAYDVVYLAVYAWQDSLDQFGDFFALSSFARFAATRASVQIYDPITLKEFQQQLRPDLAGGYPFPYPPSFLLYIWPLAHLPYLPGYLIWMGGTFAFYLLVSAGPNWRSLGGFALLVAPTSLLTAISGQSGFLAAALMTAGLRNASERPMLAGILLGLLSYKPQLGVLVPVALIAAGHWRCLAAAAGTLAGLVLASSAFFGWSIWARWITTMPLHFELFEVNRAPLNHLMPTVTASLLQLGAGPGAAWIVQVLVACVVATALWWLFRRGVTDRATAALQVGCFLATPYAFIYDMPMVASAALMDTRLRIREHAGFHPGELAIMALALGYPLFMLAPQTAKMPIESLFLALMFAMLARRAMALRGRKAVGELPGETKKVPGPIGGAWGN